MLNGMQALLLLLIELRVGNSFVLRDCSVGNSFVLCDCFVDNSIALHDYSVGKSGKISIRAQDP